MCWAVNSATCWHRVQKSHHTQQRPHLQRVGQSIQPPVGTGCGKATATQPHLETQFPVHFFGRGNPYQQNRKRKQKIFLVQKKTAREKKHEKKYGKSYFYQSVNLDLNLFSETCSKIKKKGISKKITAPHKQRKGAMTSERGP